MGMSYKNVITAEKSSSGSSLIPGTPAADRCVYKSAVTINTSIHTKYVYL